MRLVYSLYPATTRAAEYRLALRVAERYSCSTLVDVGSGPCNLCRLSGVKCVGVDLHAYPAWGRRPPASLCVVGDARSAPVYGADCVFYVNSIPYTGPEALAAARGRVAAIVDIDPRYPHVRLTSILEGVKRYTPAEAARLLEDAGYEAVEALREGPTYAVVGLRRN